ncbi:ComEC/Rec2 family competence protein, partial [Paracoccus thiocyanatus]|uniref:ComEC/Rec2 family competence protein n=1 Tax=Paracoccus thiocyanatus TaxID=34006 RepID=UPI0021624E4F
MTGDRSGIAEETNQIMRDSNLYHIISISGLHMSMLAGFVYAALRLGGVAAQAAGVLRRRPVHKLAAAGALCASALYLWLSGGGVATERAFIMVAVMLLAIIADRRAISLRTVAVAACIVLALSPEALTEPGFQMSFAATVALILVQEPWLRLSPHLPWWGRPVAMLLLSSLVAGLATAPIAAAHFGRMTQYGLLANMLVVPVVGTLVMPGGVLAALLAPLGLAQPALWLMGLGTAWMLAVAQWIADLEGAVALLPAAPRAVLPLMAVGAMMALPRAGPGGGLRLALVLRRAVA